MKQTRLGSLCEALLNTASGFIVAMITWGIVAPVFGYDITLYENFQITFIFTTVSIARSYLWRRGFNWWIHR